MTKIQNSKQAFVFEYWNLGFNWNLVLGFVILQCFATPLLGQTSTCSKDKVWT